MRKSPSTAPQWVYFIRPRGARGPVKIGLTWSPDRRLRDLQKTSPVDLELAAVVEGSPRIERGLHALFLAEHWRDEWFNWSARIENMIVEIRDGSANLSGLPEPVSLWVAQRRRDAAVAA